jgi:hypothetical protein
MYDLSTDTFDEGRLEEVLQQRGIPDLATNPELRLVIEGAMSGSLPLEEPLEVNQPKKLSPRAIQTVLLSIGGFYTLKEISAISGMDYVYVTKLVKHPYAKRIRSIAEAHAVAGLSSVDRRLRRKAPKMLKIAQRIAENPAAEPAVRLRAAFGWLDRAGYGETKKVKEEKTVNKHVTVTHKRSKLLAEAIREAGPLKEAEILEEIPPEGDEGVEIEDFSIVEAAMEYSDA